MKKLLKKIIHRWPWPLTLNERYDRQTKAVINKVCTSDSNCIDVGCFKGDILKQMIKTCPDGRHIAFEPIPEKFEILKKEFSAFADIYPFALGSENGPTVFNYVVSNPTYSGLKQREYKGEETIQEIPIEVRKLDDVVPPDMRVNLIKIDVEGGELDVLKGSKELLSRWKPILIFEHGVGAADKYDVAPGDVYDYLVDNFGYKICLMGDFLKNRNVQGFSKTQFEKQFHDKVNCYFLATQ